MKKAVFWDVTPCRSGVNRRFGGTYRLHLQGSRLLSSFINLFTRAHHWSLLCASSYHRIIFLKDSFSYYPPMSRSSLWSLSFWLLPRAYYMPCPPHPPWLDRSNYTWRRVQVMKLLIMQFSPISCHFISLRSRYSQHPVLNLPKWFFFISWCGVRLSPLGTSGINWPDGCGAVGRMRIGKGNRSTRRPAPMPLLSPQIPHDLTWARILRSYMWWDMLTQAASLMWSRIRSTPTQSLSQEAAGERLPRSPHHCELLREGWMLLCRRLICMRRADE
jgi:hypothetical protein